MIWKLWSINHLWVCINMYGIKNIQILYHHYKHPPNQTSEDSTSCGLYFLSPVKKSAFKATPCLTAVQGFVQNPKRSWKIIPDST